MDDNSSDIGVVTAREESYHPNRRLKAAAGAKGRRLILINPYRISPGIRNGRSGLWDLDKKGLPGVVLPRQGAQIGNASLVVLSQFQAMGVPLANDVGAILLARNKYLTLQALSTNRIRVPDSFFVNSPSLFWAGIEHLGGWPVVVKKPSGRQGRDVFLIREAGEGETCLANLDPAQGLLLQRFIPPEGRKDLRVLVIGKKVSAAMELVAAKGDFRSNYHVSGSGTPVELPDEIEQTAVASAQALGLVIAGVDLIIDASGTAFVIEVNYAPGFKGMEAATGRDIAAEIITYALSLISV